MYFVHSQYLFLLTLLPLFMLFGYFFWKTKEKKLRFLHIHKKLYAKARQKTCAQMIIYLLLSTSLIILMAYPTKALPSPSTIESIQEIAFILDISQEMNQPFTNHMTKFAQGKKYIQLFLNELISKEVSLTAFAEDIEPIVINTLDRTYLELILETVQSTHQQRQINLLKNSLAKLCDNKNRIVICITSTASSDLYPIIKKHENACIISLDTLNNFTNTSHQFINASTVSDQKLLELTHAYVEKYREIYTKNNYLHTMYDSSYILISWLISILTAIIWIFMFHTHTFGKKLS